MFHAEFMSGLVSTFVIANNVPDAHEITAETAYAS